MGGWINRQRHMAPPSCYLWPWVNMPVPTEQEEGTVQGTQIEDCSKTRRRVRKRGGRGVVSFPFWRLRFVYICYSLAPQCSVMKLSTLEKLREIESGWLNFIEDLQTQDIIPLHFWYLCTERGVWLSYRWEWLMTRKFCPEKLLSIASVCQTCS